LSEQESLADVRRRDLFGAFQIRDGASNIEHAVVRAGREPKSLHCPVEDVLIATQI
jgi:hypothetical protein